MACADLPMSTQTMHQFAMAVYALYRDAQIADSSRFEAQLFELLHQSIDFDAAWLGHSTLTEQGVVLHSSTLHALPPSYLSDWSRVQHLDPLVDWAKDSPQAPACLSVADADLHPDFRAFLAQHAVAQALCATAMDTELKTGLHISLYRRSIQPAFSIAEQEALQAWVPNVRAAIALNRMRDVEHTASGLSTATWGVALVSQQGVVQMANPRFAQVMRLEWPEWTGACLPTTLSLSVAAGQSKNHIGERIQLELQPREDLLMVTVRPLHLSSQLSARERAVAWHFAQGLTYKAVAKTLGIAPATVRHHLRQVYRKLGIQDKGAIAWALSQEQPSAASPNRRGLD